MAFQGNAFQQDGFQDFSENATGTSVPVLSTGGPGGARTLYYQALFYVPYVAVAAAVAFPEGWQGQLSQAAKAAPVAVQSVTYVPQPPRVHAEGWQQPLSIAAPARKAQQGGAVWVGQPLAGNNVDLGKWQQPLSIAAQRPPVQLGQAFVPFDTAQLAATPSILWQQPASVAPPRLSPPQSELRQFTVTVEVVEAPAFGWQQPTWRAVPPRPLIRVAHAQFGVEVPEPVVYGWWQPLSRAAPIPRAPQGTAFVPFNTAQVVAVAVYGWQQPLSVTPRKLPTAQTPLAPFAVDVEEDNTVTIDKWLVPLSKAAPIPRYQVGWTFVPLNTAQIVVAPSYGWFTPLSVAVPAPPAGPGGPSYVFLSTAFTQNTATYQGYQQPLSRAVPRPPVWQGHSRAPLDTAQFFTPTPTQFGWYAPLSTLASTKSPGQVAVTLLGWTFVPFDTVQVIPPPPVGGVVVPGYWYEEWERLGKRRRELNRPAPEPLPQSRTAAEPYTPSKTFKVSPRVIEALAQAKTINDIRALASEETGQTRNLLNQMIAEHKRRMKDEDDIEIILLTWS